VAVDHLPLSPESGVDGCRIPPHRRLSAIRLDRLAPEVVGEHGDIAVTLDLGSQHFVACDLDLSCDRSIVVDQSGTAIDTTLGGDVEVSDFRCVGIEKALRVAIGRASRRGSRELRRGRACLLSGDGIARAIAARGAYPVAHRRDWTRSPGASPTDVDRCSAPRGRRRRVTAASDSRVSTSDRCESEAILPAGAFSGRTRLRGSGSGCEVGRSGDGARLRRPVPHDCRVPRAQRLEPRGVGNAAVVSSVYPGRARSAHTARSALRALEIAPGQLVVLQERQLLRNPVAG